MAPVISVKNLSYKYNKGLPNESEALRNINLDIDTGELVGLIGHTGSGKSTLVQHLNGLLKPDEGEVLIDGENIWKDKSTIRAARFKVGLCFQYPEYQLFDETVAKDIAFGPINMGLSNEEVEARVLEAADFVGLNSGHLASSPFDLSGGEKRRAAIAGVMAMRPQVLIMDEPTAGLDPNGRDKILRLITDYKKRTGSTVVLVSHSMEDIAKVATKVAVMNRGELEFYSTVNEVYSHSEQLKEMGLNVPQITKIFIELSKLGFINSQDVVYDVDSGVEIISSILKRRGSGD